MALLGLRLRHIAGHLPHQYCRLTTPLTCHFKGGVMAVAMPLFGGIFMMFIWKMDQAWVGSSEGGKMVLLRQQKGSLQSLLSSLRVRAGGWRGWGFCRRTSCWLKLKSAKNFPAAVEALGDVSHVGVNAYHGANKLAFLPFTGDVPVAEANKWVLQVNCNMTKLKPKRSHGMRNTVEPRRGNNTDEGEGTKR